MAQLNTAIDEELFNRIQKTADSVGGTVVNLARLALNSAFPPEQKLKLIFKSCEIDAVGVISRTKYPFDIWFGKAVMPLDSLPKIKYGEAIRGFEVIIDDKEEGSACFASVSSDLESEYITFFGRSKLKAVKGAGG